MSGAKSLSEEILRENLAHFQEPLLFQNMLQGPDGSYEWKLFDWDLPELAKKLGDSKLPFRVGYNARLTNPQWEVNCPIKYMTLQEFLENTEKSTEGAAWYYFDYKHMQEWFKDKPEIMTSLNWRKFGIDKDGSESTLWIGSEGAHTNCHQDSYGYNLVAQIHGRKQWLLLPPNSSNFLEPTRIPYEESTIYSRYNFFCLSREDERRILDIPHKPKAIILEPGDVLFVPFGWWHYVESLDRSMSVNIWLPLKEDSKARLKEALVKLMIAKIGGQEYLMSGDRESNASYYITLVEAALQESKYETECTVLELPSKKKLKSTVWTAEDLIARYPNFVKLLGNLEGHELQKFLQEKRERFPYSSIQKVSERLIDIKTISQNQTSLECILNTLCHPDTIDKAAELLLNTYTDNRRNTVL